MFRCTYVPPAAVDGLLFRDSCALQLLCYGCRQRRQERCKHGVGFAVRFLAVACCGTNDARINLVIDARLRHPPRELLPAAKRNILLPMKYLCNIIRSTSKYCCILGRQERGGVKAPTRHGPHQTLQYTPTRRMKEERFEFVRV